MKTIEIKNVIIPENRQRRQFDESALEELRVSIAAVGLLQPIVLRNDEKTIVAGERRLRALESFQLSYNHDGLTVQAAHIPYVTLGDLPPDLLFQAELEENLRRVNLTWQEEARALGIFHRQQQASNPDQTFKGTADAASEIAGKNILGDTVSTAIALTDFLDDPLVAAAKDLKTAKKIAREIAKAQHREKQMDLFLTDASSLPHELIHGSCLTAPDSFTNYFDCIVTDPPYGINMHKKDTFDDQVHEYDDSPEAFFSLANTLPEFFRRILKPNGHLYLFCDIRRFERLYVEFFSRGYDVWPRPLIWDKGTTGAFTNTEWGFRQCYDAILFARLGTKKLAKYTRDVINIQQQTNLPHPAGKPVELMAELISRSCFPGERVADPFCGHGPIFPAASLTSTVATGWEISPKYHAMAAETLSKLSETENGKK